jgi:hypothetical protein
MSAFVQSFVHVFGSWPLADQIAVGLLWPVTAAIGCWRECVRQRSQGDPEAERHAFDVITRG